MNIVSPMLFASMGSDEDLVVNKHFQKKPLTSKVKNLTWKSNIT